MKLITEDAVVVCDHKLGKVINLPSQSLVTIAHRRVLVSSDPEMRVIVACPNIGATIKPCLLTLKVKTGYSTFIRINGHAACLETVTGLTDGTPPGGVNYAVRSPGQDFVTGVA